MDSKTLTTVAIVVLCVLFFPIAIAIAGGVFGLLGSIIGVIGGIFGGLFGVIGHIFVAIFSVFGWIFGGLFHHDWPFHPGGGKVLAVLIVVLIALAISRRDPRTRR